MAAPSGIVWGSTVGDYGRIGIYAGVTNSNTQTTVKVEVWFWSKYSVSDTANSYYYNNLTTAGSATSLVGSINIHTTVDSGSGWSTSNQVKLGESTYTYDRGTSNVTRYLRAKLANVDRVGGTMTAAHYFMIPKLTSYTITYNANGGSGAPTSQTKWYGKALTLSSTEPVRNGYIFKGWATSSSGAVTYKSGASYTANAGVTLYAVWEAITYTITYYANGGTMAPNTQYKTHGVSIRISDVVPIRTDYRCIGWSFSPDSNFVQYTPYQVYTGNANLVLYAVWELAYVRPRLTNLWIVRTDQNDNETEDGTYAKVILDYECDKSPVSVIIEYKPTTSDEWTPYNISMHHAPTSYEGQSWSRIGGSFDPEQSYDFRITFEDEGGSTEITGILPSMQFAIDVLAGGRGVAFGKTAELENTAEFEFDAKFNGPVYGNVLGLNRLPEIPANDDLNNYMTTGSYAVYKNANAETIANIPVAKAGRLEVSSATGEGIRSEQWSYLRQKYIPYSLNFPIYERDISRSDNNVWTYNDWVITSLHGQKVLWSGDSTMNGDQSIHLTDVVSNQSNGIVLIFAVDGSDSNFNSFFVPRKFVELMPGMGSAFNMNTVTFSVMATKYLYISNNHITGNDYNEQKGSTNGITYDNSSYVLRYVIGV